MQNSLVPKQQSVIEVEQQPLRTVLTEDELSPLALVLPPVEDLADIAVLKNQYSFEEESFNQFSTARRMAFEAELEREARKEARFADSPVYFNKLASLAHAAGRFEEERDYVVRARSLSSDSVYVHRYGDTLLLNNREDEAESLFASLADQKDLYALLKVAALQVRRLAIAPARDLVDRAVSLDPTDFSARLFEGGLALYAGQFKRALHSLRVASQERPNSSVVFENMASAYLRLSQTEKAFAALKRAVSLNPFNVAALFVLADEAFKLERDDDVINSLRFYVDMNPKHPDAWARLARAQMRIKEYEGAVSALKREASLRDTSGVWNNLGAVRAMQGIGERALECFKHAIEKGDGDKDSMIAARNIARLLVSSGEPTMLTDYTTAIIAEDREFTFLQDSQLADLYAFHLYGLALEQRSEEVVRVSEAILANPKTARTLYVWVLSQLLSYYCIQLDAPKKALDAIAKWLPAVDAHLDPTLAPNATLINNVAFSYAENAYCQAAARYINRISQLIHKEPFPTATLGLIDLKRGNIERGRARYQEAINLARTPKDKATIRQKVAIELARLSLRDDPQRARRFLLRASKIPNGEPAFVELATREMRSLTFMSRELPPSVE
jgi:tetratricopeptide (TPR) repeat protein